MMTARSRPVGGTVHVAVTRGLIRGSCCRLRKCSTSVLGTARWELCLAIEIQRGRTDSHRPTALLHRLLQPLLGPRQFLHNNRTSGCVWSFYIRDRLTQRRPRTSAWLTSKHSSSHQQIFQKKSSGRLQILGARWVKLSRFHTAGPQFCSDLWTPGVWRSLLGAGELTFLYARKTNTLIRVCWQYLTPPRKCIRLGQCFSTFVRPRPGQFFFIRRGPSPNRFTRQCLSNSFKFIH